MSGYGFNIALVVVLVILNAAFAGSEMALISLREGQIKQLEREGSPTSLRLVRLARDPNRFLATIQIGITLAGFLASATAAVSLAEPVTPLLSFLGGAAGAVSVALVTLVLTFFTLVFGELAPKRLAMQMALPWARVAVAPLDVLSRVSRPAVWLLAVSTNAVVRLLGGRTETESEELSPDELREIVTAHRGLSPEQRQIIGGALEIHERTLREVLVPRMSVFALDADVPVGEARQQLADVGHSRAPVIRGGRLDDVLGVAHWAALADAGAADAGDARSTVADVMSPAMVLPDSVRVSAALRQMRTERKQLAVVIDEHGAVDGIVTLEDLLEEIVGEIYDETDKDLMAVRRQDDGAFLLPGTFPVHDLPDIDARIEVVQHSDYTTVAGLLLHHLGHIPRQPGEHVDVGTWRLTVASVDRRAITGVRLEERQPVSDESVPGAATPQTARDA
ncbi:hemolysin family protein [Terracoccus luteus]|uniref:Putative hemolysin n=1 Tax=Terracoccus luteus TaxID=53356 RepID=A0A839PWG6_9MICO|nr:hemolysin family protein [Terracoccus luteus]MBB2987064.1 putative hemolysin [Terracoccus luteus]MCP2172715.1 putative hemolysin [Terracoccus luteus]